MLTSIELPMTEGQRARLLTLLGKGFRERITRLLWGPELVETFQSRLEIDLARGVLQQLEVGVERMACGEEELDEGPFFFSDLGDGQVLCLAGQWLYDPHIVLEAPMEDDEATWFQNYTLLRAPRTGIVFELRPQGPELSRCERQIPSRAIPFFGESALVQGSIDNLEIVLKSLDSVNPRS